MNSWIQEMTTTPTWWYDHHRSVLSVNDTTAVTIGILVALSVALFSRSLWSRWTVENTSQKTAVWKAPEMNKIPFTAESLASYNGRERPEIYIAVCRRVYDVSRSASFYGPGGVYENFAGRDASLALAKNSFEMSMFSSHCDETNEMKTHLTEEEKESLNQWASFFHAKYFQVGVLAGEDVYKSI